MSDGGMRVKVGQTMITRWVGYYPTRIYGERDGL